MGYDIRKNEELRIFSTDKSLPIYISAVGTSYPDARYRVRRGMSMTTVVEYVLDGEGYVMMNGETHRVEKGQIYILPSGIPHDYFSNADAPMHKIWINYRGQTVTRMLKEYGLENQWLFDGTGLKPIFEKAQSLILSDKSDTECQSILTGLYFELLLNLHYACKNTAHSPDAVTMKTYLDANSRRAVSNGELASLIFRSTDYCIKLFKNEYGVTPYDYQLTQRMQLACRMLTQTTMEISAIAAEIGFEDAHYFSRIFKQKYRVTPKQYRNNSQK